MYGPFTIEQIALIGIVVVVIGFIGLGVAYYSFMVTKNKTHFRIGLAVAIICIVVLPFTFTVASSYMSGTPLQ